MKKGIGMIYRSLVLGAASLTLIACEPIESSGGDTASTVVSSSSETPMPSGLTGEEQGIWNTFTDAGKKLVSDCMAGGKSFKTCAG